jgi:hypothetical protein
MPAAVPPRTVYVLAGEYSAPADAATPGLRLREGAQRQEPGSSALEDLMSRAGERALNMLHLGDEGRLRIDQLLMTTMPDVGGSAMAHAIHLPNVLKRRLQLAETCQARFEVGSSDAGASLFASAVHLLKGLDAPGTALVVAGQIMPGGRDAIQTVSQVLDQPERDLGRDDDRRGRPAARPRGLAVAAGARPPPLPARAGRGRTVADIAPPPPEAFAAEVEAMVRHKLALAASSTRRRSVAADDGRGPNGAAPISRWMTDWHLALASQRRLRRGAHHRRDARAVSGWRATGQRRAVRVLGVGEGDADPRLAMRAEPFAFFKSLRQALVSLRRNDGHEPRLPALLGLLPSCTTRSPASNTPFCWAWASRRPRPCGARARTGPTLRRTHRVRARAGGFGPGADRQGVPRLHPAPAYIRGAPGPCTRTRCIPTKPSTA